MCSRGAKPYAATEPIRLLVNQQETQTGKLTYLLSISDEAFGCVDVKALNSPGSPSEQSLQSIVA